MTCLLEETNGRFSSYVRTYLTGLPYGELRILPWPGPSTGSTCDPSLLYHLGHDPSEKYDVAKDHPDVIADILKEVEKHRANLTPAEDLLVKRLPKQG